MGILIKEKIEIGAKFNFVKGSLNDEGVEVENFESGWFDNLVLDVGLDKLGNNNDKMQYVWVGTGNLTPANDQIRLQSGFALVGSAADVSQTMTYDDNYVYFTRKRRYRFNAGVFNNTNLAEVGVSDNANLTTGTLFNRALIRDINGDPTTITVKPEEYLDVFVELRCRQSTAVKTGNLDLGLSQHTYRIRPTFVDYSAGSGFNVGTGISERYMTSSTYAPVYTGNLPVSIATSPTGYIGSGGSAIQAYVSGSLKRAMIKTYNLTQGNGQIATMGLHTNGIPTVSYMEFTPPIDKTNTRTLSITVEVSWARFT